MTTSHATPTPPQPRPGEEGGRPGEERPRLGEEQQRLGDEQPRQADDRGRVGGDADNVYGKIANSGLFGLRPWQALCAAGAITFVLGLIVLIWPGATLLVLALLFGCYLVLSGVMSLIEGLSEHHTDGAMRVAYIVLGVLGVLLGLFCLRRIDVTVLLLAFMLSAFWIMRGVVDLAAAMSPRPVSGRGLRGFTGVLSLIAGVLVLFWPGITLTTLLVFAGCWLLIYGATLAFLGLGLRRALSD
jgi:uncharacterized membrane protein HdeD (DUF308 family)